MNWFWHNEKGEQGMLTVDLDGVVVLMVDDPYYSGALNRDDSIAMARVILAVPHAATPPVERDPHPAEELEP